MLKNIRMIYSGTQRIQANLKIGNKWCRNINAAKWISQISITRTFYRKGKGLQCTGMTQFKLLKKTFSKNFKGELSKSLPYTSVLDFFL